MAVKLIYNELIQELDGNGAPYAGAQIFTYSGGSSTKLTTYKDSSGSTSNTNPIVLDANGRIPFAIWGTVGSTYKFVLAPSNDTDPPVSPIWTLDGITGINDATASLDEWVAGPTPTFINTTQFSLVGDQTSIFTINRRLKFSVTAGTVYARITVSSYTSLTTVTVQLDGSQTLDSGLSAVSYSLLSAKNQSIPHRIGTTSGTNTYTANIGIVSYNVGDEYEIKVASANTSTTPTFAFDGLSAITIIRSDGTSLLSGDMSGQHTFRYDGTNMVLLNPLARTSTGGGTGGLIFVYRNFT